MNSKEAAAYLGISELLLRTLRARGRGPKRTKVGNQFQYDKAELDRFKKAKLTQT